MAENKRYMFMCIVIIFVNHNESSTISDSESSDMNPKHCGPIDYSCACALTVSHTKPRCMHSAQLMYSEPEKAITIISLEVHMYT